MTGTCKTTPNERVDDPDIIVVETLGAVSAIREGILDGKNGTLYARLALGVGCLAAGIALGQMVDQRLMLVAMFPAVALLSGVIARLTAPHPPKMPETEHQPPALSAAEREILAAIWNAGELGLSEAAGRTSLSEPEATETLSGLAGRGYLSARETNGATVYGRAVG